MEPRSVQAASLLGFMGALASAALAIPLWIESPVLVIVAVAASSAAAVGIATLKRSMTDMTTQLARCEEEHRRDEVDLIDQRTAIDHLSDGLDLALFVCSPQAEVLYANRRAVELFGFQNPIGRSVLAVTLSQELDNLVHEPQTGEDADTVEVRFTFPTERVGLAKAWSAADSPGRVFLTIYDVTELRRLMRVRQDFVANVSHELRTPMTVIRAMAETLLDDCEEDDERGQRYLKRIIAEIDRLDTVSKDLLILSSAESNAPVLEPCDIALIFRGVSDELAPQARAKSLEFAYDGPESLVIDANPNQITQVAINLIQNAINYTVVGSIRVAVSEGEDVAVVTVADTGVGIASDHQTRIFERFYRVDKARSRSTGGTGLGLSIVKHIVESHGGTVSVQSALGQGSTFTVRLPIGGQAV